MSTASVTPSVSNASSPTISIPDDQPIAVVTGASSGFGEAIARTLAEQGYHVVVGARRMDRIQALAEQIGGTGVHLDVTNHDSVTALAVLLPRVDVLVNNAGGAKGLASVFNADFADWRWMWETNVLGTLRVTQALLPQIIASGNGLIVTITSIAALDTYENGSGYTSAKHAESALHNTLREELLGKPVRLTEICPGKAETEFSLVRFHGDTMQANAVYQDMTPLVAQDIADIVVFVASRPSHVNIDRIIVKPRDQYSMTKEYKHPDHSSSSLSAPTPIAIPTSA